ncbi:hypothetical protein DRN76_02100 [Methanosarcinales archaeon]|nr:MAG: hypothetical protein DRN76_02100 [Methanosarcinales archaeon]
MMLRIRGWMVYLQMSMGGGLCVWHQVDYNIITKNQIKIPGLLNNTPSQDTNKEASIGQKDPSN